MDIELGADKQSDCGAEPSIRLQHLSISIFNNIFQFFQFNFQLFQVFVFRTCGGCFSITKEDLTRESRRTLSPSASSGRMFMLVSWLGMFSPSWIISSCRICCRFNQIISARSSHLSDIWSYICFPFPTNYVSFLNVTDSVLELMNLQRSAT